jgi:hypothetical protein
MNTNQNENKLPINYNSSPGYLELDQNQVWISELELDYFF